MAWRYGTRETAASFWFRGEQLKMLFHVTNHHWSASTFRTWNVDSGLRHSALFPRISDVPSPGHQGERERDNDHRQDCSLFRVYYAHVPGSGELKADCDSVELNSCLRFSLDHFCVPCINYGFTGEACESQNSINIFVLVLCFVVRTFSHICENIFELLHRLWFIQVCLVYFLYCFLARMYT